MQAMCVAQCRSTIVAGGCVRILGLSPQTMVRTAVPARRMTDIRPLSYGYSQATPASATLHSDWLMPMSHDLSFHYYIIPIITCYLIMLSLPRCVLYAMS